MSHVHRKTTTTRVNHIRQAPIPGCRALTATHLRLTEPVRKVACFAMRTPR